MLKLVGFFCIKTKVLLTSTLCFYMGYLWHFFIAASNKFLNVPVLTVRLCISVWMKQCSVGIKGPKIFCCISFKGRGKKSFKSQHLCFQRCSLHTLVVTSGYQSYCLSSSTLSSHSPSDLWHQQGISSQRTAHSWDIFSLSTHWDGCVGKSQ